MIIFLKGFFNYCRFKKNTRTTNTRPATTGLICMLKKKNLLVRDVNFYSYIIPYYFRPWHLNPSIDSLDVWQNGRFLNKTSFRNHPKAAFINLLSGSTTKAMLF